MNFLCQVEPEFGLIEQIVINDIQDVFGVDALESSHPISVEVNDPNEINELFDDISYAKGIFPLLLLFRKRTMLFTLPDNYLEHRRVNYSDVEQIPRRAVISCWFN